jgi:hypothetical protein
MWHKSAYVKTMRGVRAVARRAGVRTPRPGERGRRAHLRSLLAIHDADALIEMDLPWWTWWTYRAVDAVDAFLLTRDHARVFEYGSGASTVWLSRRADEVHTVEHDLAWAANLRPRFGGFENITLHVVEPTASVETVVAGSGRRGFSGLDFERYVNTVHEVGGLFDVIVIDGRARMACLEASLVHLAPGGWIVVDNSRRSRYRDGLTSSPVHIERFRGSTPGLPYPDETAVLRLVEAPMSDIPAPRSPATVRSETLPAAGSE